jgi:hypothetical protein
MTDESNPIRPVLQRLRTHGWRRWRFGPEAGPNCLAGAVNRVYPWSEREAVFKLIAREIQEQFPDRKTRRGASGAVITFNTYTTGFHEVEVMLEMAALRWDEAHSVTTQHVEAPEAPELEHLSVFAQAAERRSGLAANGVPVDRDVVVHRSFILDQRSGDPLADPDSADVVEIELASYELV